MDDPNLESLEERIKKAQQHHNPPKSNDDSRAGMQAGVELVGAIAIACAIGYGLDQWLGTQPLFIILMFFLGVATGFYNVYRVTQNLGTNVGHSGLSDEKKKATTSLNNEESTKD